MNDPLQPNVCANLLSALAAPERLRIVRYLTAGPRTVTEIAAMLESPIVNTSHHLAVLRNAGLLRNERHGRFIHYSLAPGVFPAETEDAANKSLNLGCCRIELPL